MVDDCVFFIFSQTATWPWYAISHSEARVTFIISYKSYNFFSFLRLESVEDRHLTAPDPHPEIRGGGEGGRRSPKTKGGPWNSPLDLPSPKYSNDNSTRNGTPRSIITFSNFLKKRQGRLN